MGRPQRLLERGEEIELIAKAIAEPGRVLIVEGEAGIGKSALLREAAELAHEAGARVFSACGGSLECDFGHGLTRQLFERPLREASASTRRRWLAGAAGLAAPVLGLDRTADGGLADNPAFAAQHGLYWLAANIAADERVVLVVDDLHWADLASFGWLVYLARRLEGLPILVLGGWRVGEPQSPHELLDALQAERIAPRRLSVTAAASLVERELGRPCDAGTATACHLATRGNPLLLAQLAHALDSEELPLDAARVNAVGSRAVGPYVRALLARMPPPTSDVAAAAAVLASALAPRRLVALTGLAVADVREVCDRLVDARLLVGGEVFEFSHPLIRSAIYEMLSPARRAATHRTVADLLDAERLTDLAAVHLLAAERTGDPAVVARLLIAAKRAATRGAVHEAVVLLSRALDEPPAIAAHHEVLMALACAEWLARDEAAVEHARRALEFAAGASECEAAALLLAGLLGPVGRQQEAVDMLARIADQLRESAPDCAVRLDIQRLAWSLMLPRVPRGTKEAARALAARVFPGSLAAQVLNGAIAVLDATTGARPASATAQLALEVVSDRRLLDDLSTTFPFHWALAALGYCEHLDDYSRCVEQRREHAARAGSWVEPPLLAGHRAWIAWLRGDLPAAIAEAQESLDEPTSYQFFVPFAACSLASALLEQGDVDEAEHVLARHQINDGMTFLWRMLVPTRIKVALAQGDVQAARAQLSPVGRELELLPLHLAPSEVAVALASGDTEHAQERARAMLTVAQRFGAPGALGTAQRLLGLATGGSAGLELLRRAVETLRVSARRLEFSHALVDYGAALRRQRQRANAREPLRFGLDLAQRCRASALAQTAAEELRATGARPRRLHLTGVESLTPSELRIARMVAQGHSNPDVAQALYVTRSTVESHLRSTFRKLDITSREQLSATLRD